MRNDISVVRAAAGVAALALALAGCGSDAPPRPDDPVPPQAEQAAPEISATEGEGSGSGGAVALQDNAPLRYIVKKGDTLWDIANKFLKDSWQWPEVWTANEKVANPHLIYPGDELYLYYVDGAPRVAVAQAPGETAPAEVLPPGGMGDMTPRARESALDQAIYSIPLDAIRAFLKGPRMIDEDLLDDAPYLLAFQSDKLLGGADEIAYALDVEDTSVTQYQLVRKGEEYRDPDDNDVIGFEVLPVGDAEIRAFGDPATIFLRRSDMEARAGDYLLPLDQDPLATRFIPHAPDKAVDGKIISVYNGVSQIGQYQVVTINRGTEQGMEPGHVLSVMQTGRKAKDPYALFGGNVRLPEQKAGTIMVFKTAPRMSYALVMSATQPIHVLDKVEKPEPGN